jgi:hypothetical protein
MYLTRYTALAGWITETVFWLLLLAAQLPTVGVLWFAAGLLQLSDPFRSYAADLVRWPRWG